MPLCQYFRRCALLALSLVSVASIAGDSEESTPVLQHDIVYGNADGVELKLHLAKPVPNKQGFNPGVLFFHRGGWISGSKDRYLDVIEEFASHGYVAASVGYRFAPKHKFPAQIEDAKCAVRWMRAHAGELGVDPDRIAAIGESAGGHLSMLLGTLDPDDGLEGSGGWHDQSSKVQAVVSFYGPVDLRWDQVIDSPYAERFQSALAQRLLSALVGGDPTENRESLFRASPIKYVDRRDAPMLLLQGTSDPLVLPDQALKMASALTKAGVSGRMEYIFGKVHDWDGEDFLRPLSRARRFLDQQFKRIDQPENAEAAAGAEWNPQLAAKALDQRAREWDGWSRSQRSHDTTCISCHSGLPYLLARGSLSRSIGQSEVAQVYQDLSSDIRRRVESREDVEPWYHFSDQKSKESLANESVISALILSLQDAESDSQTLTQATRNALDWMWETQETEGPNRGSWPWLDFDLDPFESETSRYWGATLAAIGVGIAPEDYADRPEIQANVDALRQYLQDHFSDQPPHHHATALIASTRLNGLWDRQWRESTAQALVNRQREDGSWSLSDLGNWKRPNTAGDAYATGLVVYALVQVDRQRFDKAIDNGRSWLIQNQHPETGSWAATSVNKLRDPDSFVGKFMQDAASAYATMALLATD